MTEKLTKKEVLNTYYNQFLTQNISAEIDIEIYKRIIQSQGENFIVEEKNVPIGELNGKMQYTVMKLKAKDALLNNQKRFDDTKRVLQVIEDLSNNV